LANPEASKRLKSNFRIILIFLKKIGFYVGLILFGGGTGAGTLVGEGTKRNFLVICCIFGRTRT